MLENPHLRLIREDTIRNAGGLIGPSDYLALGYVADGFDLRPHFSEEFRQGVVAANPTTLYYTSRISGANLLGLGRSAVGNVVSILDLPDNLHPGPGGELAQVCQMMFELCRVLGARYWTGLGRIPAVIRGSGTPVDEMFIPGDIGSRTAVRFSLEQILELEGLDSSNITLGVLGAAGVLGSRVARSARDRGFRVVGCDIRFRVEQQSRNLLLTDDPRKLAECQILINAASEGDALLTVIEYLKKGVLVVEDTYPRPSDDTIRRILEIGRLFWVGVQREGISIDPSFPGRVEKEIAGCLLETIVTVLVGFRISSPQRFYDIARQLRFEALLQEVTL